MAEDSATRLSVEPVVIVDPAMSPLVVFATTLPATAMPAEPPPPETPKPSASTMDMSVAEMVTAPPAFTSDPSTTPACVVLVMTLAESETSPAAEPTAAPPVKLMISAVDSAPRLRLESVETVEPEISAASVLVITLAPMIPERASDPDPAKLSPIDMMFEASVAVCSTKPPAVTMDPLLIEASTVLVITLPNPVAFNATAPEPATPAVSEMTAALD